MNHGCSCKCGESSPTQVLKNEHRVIERVLDAVDRHLWNSRLDPTFCEKALDFFRNFADGCHHAKEEDELFPVLESAGILHEGGPIGCLLHEHRRGRELLRIARESLVAACCGDARALHRVRRAFNDYVGLLRAHILKEDNVLFVLADEALGPEERHLMMGAFERAEHAAGRSGRHEYYVGLAEELSRASLAVA